jgi:DNA-binding XRE family transcriptional regulator
MAGMVTDTIERIRAHLKLPGVTKKGLAEDAGLHPNTLQGIEDEAWNPSASTLKALEAQLPPPQEQAA